MRLNEIQVWLETAVAGDRVVYHVGKLASDRNKGSNGATPESIEIDRVATAMYDASARGAVCLVQRRNGNGIYEYVAVRRCP